MATKFYYFLILLFATSYITFSQEQFQETLYLEVCGNYGKLWGRNNIEWELPVITKQSVLDNQLWGHMLAKSVLNGQKFLLTLKEIEYFADLSGIHIEYIGNPICNPEHWNTKFENLIQPLYFKKPLKALIISNKNVELISIDALSGEKFYTFYPHGEIFPKDNKSVPIIFKNDALKFSKANMIILISDYGLSILDINAIKVVKETVSLGEKISPRKLQISKIDLDNNGETDIIFFEESYYNLNVGNDENTNYFARFIAMCHKKKWYRTSFSEKGDDGVIGF